MILRRMGKERLTLRTLVALFVMVFAFFGGQMASLGATSSLVTAYATDPLSGVALSGYDPVSYFTEDQPLPGRPEFEQYWAGVPWFFANAANRDVFLRSPEAFAPVFGGYGTMSVARGYLSAGNPRIFLVLGNRLFLFYSFGNRDAFMLEPRAAYERAAANWANLSKDLSH